MKLNPDIENCAPAPIAEAWSWLDQRTDGAELLDVCQAVPSYLPEQSLLDHLGQSIAQGKAATYTDISGIPSLRSALARDINHRYASHLVGENVSITAGCNQAFCSVVDTLCRSGDEVIAALPCYFNHEMWFNIRGIRPKWLDFNPADALPDPDQIDELVSDKTRAIVLVSPNNPTGAIYPSTLLKAFFQAAKRHQLALVIDETYRDFMDPFAPPHDLFGESDWESHFIHLYSFSKSFSLTGHRVGAVVAGRDFLKQMNKVQDCVAISAPHGGQVAACYGLDHLTEWRDENGRAMNQRAEAIKAAFARPGLGYRIISAGAYFAYVRHPFAFSAYEVAKRLAIEYSVLCLPGTYFGVGQDQYLRFAFANLPEERFPELIDRLETSLDMDHSVNRSG